MYTRQASIYPSMVHSSSLPKASLTDLLCVYFLLSISQFQWGFFLFCRNMTVTVILATMRVGKVCLTTWWLSPIFDGFSTGQRFVHSGMNFCNVLRFFAGEAIFSSYELGSQSCRFFPSYGILFPVKNNPQTSQLFTTGVQVKLSTAT